MTTPAFRATNELALHVPDPDVAARFYESVLDCRVAERLPDCIEMRNGALRLFLVRDPASTHDRVIPSFEVIDRDVAMALLESRGCTTVPIGPHAPGGVYLRDPFGVIFDVTERSSV
jgi:catechol 2,3-dioxygenase-like lactoylglutathione lyase family enzyme